MTIFMVYFMDMAKVNIHQIKAQLSQYLDMVERGEVVVICKRNVPVAEIRPLTNKEKKIPELGWANGVLKIPASVKDMSPEEVKQWEGDENDPLRKYAPQRKRRK